MFTSAMTRDMYVTFVVETGEVIHSVRGLALRNGCPFPQMTFETFTCMPLSFPEASAVAFARVCSVGSVDLHSVLRLAAVIVSTAALIRLHTTGTVEGD